MVQQERLTLTLESVYSDEHDSLRTLGFAVGPAGQLKTFRDRWDSGGRSVYLAARTATKLVGAARLTPVLAGDGMLNVWTHGEINNPQGTIEASRIVVHPDYRGSGLYKVLTLKGNAIASRSGGDVAMVIDTDLFAKAWLCREAGFETQPDSEIGSFDLPGLEAERIAVFHVKARPDPARFEALFNVHRERCGITDSVNGFRF